MIRTLTAFADERLISGTTLVDTSMLPWPGITFSASTSASDEHVEQSYQLLAQHLDVDRSKIHSVHQVHGIQIATLADVSSATVADALICDQPGHIIGVKIADCCGVLIHDPRHHVVAAIHSGWRGTAQQIVAKTIDVLRSTYRTSPEDLRLYFSACASGDNYEVGEDVFAALADHCLPHPVHHGKWLFDNHAALRQEASMAGVPAGQIIVEPACTIADHRFHSHRRDRERAGRCYAFIGMR